MDSMRRNAQKMMPHVMALNKKPTMGMKNDRQPAPAVSKLVAFAKGGKVMAKGGAFNMKAEMKADMKQDKAMLARHNRLMHPGQKSKLAKGGTVATDKKPAYDKTDEDAFYAAMKAEKSFRSAYGDKANKSVTTTGTSVAAQKPIRASKKQSDMGLADDDTYERSNRAEKSAKKILDGYTRGGMVKKYADGGAVNPFAKKFEKERDEPVKSLKGEEPKKASAEEKKEMSVKPLVKKAKGGKAKGDKKKVMGTVGEAKAVMAALQKARRPATPMPGTRMAGLGMAPPMAPQMAPPMKRGGKVMKKAAGGAAKLRKKSPMPDKIRKVPYVNGG